MRALGAPLTCARSKVNSSARFSSLESTRIAPCRYAQSGRIPNSAAPFPPRGALRSSRCDLSGHLWRVALLRGAFTQCSVSPPSGTLPRVVKGSWSIPPRLLVFLVFNLLPQTELKLHILGRSILSVLVSRQRRYSSFVNIMRRRKGTVRARQSRRTLRPWRG